MMKLSHRLETIASYVESGSRIADIGTDHGYIPIYLIEKGIAKSALAMDVRPGPLMRADSHIKEYKLEHQIKTRLSDGLEKLQPEEADTVIIAGMGGDLMIRILARGMHVWESTKCFILSPQSDIHKVRRYLEAQEFRITKETMVLEEYKYYTVMAVERGYMHYGKESYYQYGKLLIKQKHPVLIAYLEREKRKRETILNQIFDLAKTADEADTRCETLRQELFWIKEAQDEMQ